MRHPGIWGLVGVTVASSLMALPADAQIKDLTKAAGKLADKVMGKEVSATTVSATAVVPAASNDKSARVTLLDKQNNRRQVLVLTSGEPQTTGSVVVKLTKCMPDYAGVLGQDVAWLDVTEGAEGSRSTPWFSGWMFNTYPEISTLDHPRYDIQLQGCGVKARQVIKASGSAPVLDTAPVGDTETPNDVSVTDEDNGSAGKDPYYVPGVDKNAAPAEPASPITEPAAPAAEAPADTESPAAPANVEPQAGPADGQQDLHKMMDSGQY